MIRTTARTASRSSATRLYCSAWLRLARAMVREDMVVENGEVYLPDLKECDV